MNSLKAFVAYVIMAAPVQAGAICDDLWFSRNLEFDRAGYCFGSDLGKTVFDNSDCHTNTPELSTVQKQRIAAVKLLEADYQCDIDTSGADFHLPTFELRKSLVDQPVPADFESACIGWIGPIRPLRDTASDKGRVTEVLQFGDTATFQHETKNGYEFYHLYRGNALVGVGWAALPNWEKHCSNLAG